MTERKLATIQRVKDLIAIAGADKIELAIINGWQVVTQKGQHKVGDLVVFYEIDSWLPADDPRYESFAERFTNWGDKRGMRLKTIKLRKQLSQGLIMPVRNFAELDGGIQAGIIEGLDVTEILKIEKWEPIEKDFPDRQVQAQGEKRFPSFIPKTDQERCQNFEHMITNALDEEFEITLKRDGSSMTVFRVDTDSPHYKVAKALYKKDSTIWQKIKNFFKPEKETEVYGICSRNILLPLEGNSNFHIAAAPVLEAMKEVKGSYAVQGEVTAPDIQDNHEQVSAVQFDMFDLYNIDEQKYVLPNPRQIWAKENGIKHVTVVASGVLRDIINLNDGQNLVNVLLNFAEGKSDNPKVDREGLVFKAWKRDFSFKAVSNTYLLKTGK